MFRFCAQISEKRKAADDRIVSPHWGGSTNPDGGLTIPKVAPTDAAAKDKIKRTERAATKATVGERRLQHREVLDGCKPWQGSRCFNRWLLEQGECVLDGFQEAEEAELPRVCCYCAVFVDRSVCRRDNGT